jgi:Mg2+-importing ATPase
MLADEAATMSSDAVVAALGTDARSGLYGGTVARRRALAGPNAVRSHRADAVEVLFRQLRSPLLALLVVTAAVSFVLGERTDAVIITAILAASVGLGFANEYRAERATEALHAGVHHTVVAVRDGTPRPLDVVDLVPGDLVQLRLGTVVPADLRLVDTRGLECDESVLTGESLPVVKGTEPVRAGTAPADQRCVAFMGTVVRAGAGSGVVSATGPRTEFGRIAADLGARQPATDFQVGLRRFSLLLVRVGIVLTTLILVINLMDRSRAASSAQPNRPQMLI